MTGRPRTGGGDGTFHGPLQPVEPDTDNRAPTARADRRTTESSTATPQPAVKPTLAHLAGRFGSAPRALRFAADLSTVVSAAGIRFWTDQTSWWVAADDVELHFGRAAIEAAQGQPFVQVDGLFTRDRGFGTPPSSARDAVDPATLPPIGLLDVVEQSGIYPQRPRLQEEAVVVLPGSIATSVVRRMLDIDPEVQHRMVRLSPLFSGASPGGEPTVMVELTMRARATKTLPPSLLSSIARQPLTLVGRTGRDHKVLMQRGMASALADDRLESLADEGIWVLADAAFGCWRLDPLAEFAPAASLVRINAGITTQNAQPIGDHGTIVSSPVRLIPSPARRRLVDAVLLESSDLDNLALLLENEPLAETAVLVPGTSRHLLLAPGGILQDLGLGEPLVCVGPGPLYLPLGRRLSPLVPATARADLYQPDEHHAVVVTESAAMRFELDSRRPVWSLWLGPPADVDTQLPAETLTVLSGIDDARLDAPPRRQQRLPVQDARHEPTADWHEEALRAELAGDLPRAAALHRSHNDPLRAARLYERAAAQWSEQSTEPPPQQPGSFWSRRRGRPSGS